MNAVVPSFSWRTGIVNSTLSFKYWRTWHATRFFLLLAECQGEAYIAYDNFMRGVEGGVREVNSIEVRDFPSELTSSCDADGGRKVEKVEETPCGH